MIKISRERNQLFPAFYYLTLVQHTKHSVLNPLNRLFSLIKLLAQFLHLIIIRHQNNTPCEIFTVTPRPVSNPASASQSPLRCRLGLRVYPVGILV